MLRVPPIAALVELATGPGCRVALVVVAVAHLRLGPSSSATMSTTDRALPASAVQGLMQADRYLVVCR